MPSMGRSGTWLALAAAAGLGPGGVRGQEPQLPVEVLYRALDAERTYTMAVPRTPPGEGGYPLILALHYWMGPSGAPTYFGLRFGGELVLPALHELNAIVVIPDAPAGTWAHPRAEQMVLEVLDEVRRDFPIDARRTLVTGFSMGGNGAWFFAARHPDRFRAAVPVSASPLVRPVEDQRAELAAVRAALADERGAWAGALTRVPLYLIHSRGDEAVPFEAIERAVEAVRRHGGTVTLAPVDGLPHHQVPAYIEPLREAIPWIRTVWDRP